jgi:acyl-CoA synthetase (AMP-forming)/AMP-acid ligase II
MLISVAAAGAVFLALTFVAWRRYLWAADKVAPAVTCPYSLKDVFGDRYLANVPHQRGVRWLTDVYSRSAEKFPHLPALQIPHTGESLTFAELDARAENLAAALSSFLTGPDQVVAVAMSQDNWQIVAAHLGILKAGATVMFLDTTLPDVLITHMLNDARPVVILTRGQAKFRDLPTLDVMTLPERMPPREPPSWLDDPTQRLATIFYTSGTTGMPKGVECPHAGYVNLALNYADYLDLAAGMDATSLTSSLGYDGSISEMYSAWVAGCAVVMLTKEQIRSGPDLVPVLREAEVTVLFCPPVLLTTLTPTPEVDLPYPLCRYIVPAGEAFPSALVEPWTRGRRQIINTYGPTEASTDTSRQSLRPGEPSPSARRSPTSPMSSSRWTNCARCRTGRLASSASAGYTWRAGTAICRSKPPRSSSRIPASAASTAPGINAESTSERSACTSSAASMRSSKCADIASRRRPSRTSCRPSSARSRPPSWTTRTRSSSPSWPRHRSAKAGFRWSHQRQRNGRPE